MIKLNDGDSVIKQWIDNSLFLTNMRVSYISKESFGSIMLDQISFCGRLLVHNKNHIIIAIVLFLTSVIYGFYMGMGPLFFLVGAIPSVVLIVLYFLTKKVYNSNFIFWRKN